MKGTVCSHTLVQFAQTNVGQFGKSPQVILEIDFGLKMVYVPSPLRSEPKRNPEGRGVGAESAADLIPHSSGSWGGRRQGPEGPWFRAPTERLGI